MYGNPYTVHGVDFIQPGQAKGYIVMRITNFGPSSQFQINASNGYVNLDVRIEPNLGCEVTGLTSLAVGGAITYSLFNSKHT